jgi:hypothetical protein
MVSASYFLSSQVSIFSGTFLMTALYLGACREDKPSKRGQTGGRFTSGRYGNAGILFGSDLCSVVPVMIMIWTLSWLKNGKNHGC